MRVAEAEVRHAAQRDCCHSQHQSGVPTRRRARALVWRGGAWRLCRRMASADRPRRRDRYGSAGPAQCDRAPRGPAPRSASPLGGTPRYGAGFGHDGRPLQADAAGRTSVRAWRRGQQRLPRRIHAGPAKPRRKPARLRRDLRGGGGRGIPVQGNRPSSRPRRALRFRHRRGADGTADRAGVQGMRALDDRHRREVGTYVQTAGGDRCDRDRAGSPAASSRERSRRKYPPPAAGRIDLHLHDVPGGRRAKYRACLRAPDIRLPHTPGANRSGSLESTSSHSLRLSPEISQLQRV